MVSYRVGPGWAVACALMLAGCSTLAGNAQTIVASAKTPDAPVPMPARVRLLDDAVQVVAPSGPVMLAQEFELTLEGQTGSIDRISVTQWVEAGDGQWREVYQGFRSEAPERRGVTMVVKVAPYQVGKVQLRVTGTGNTGDELETLHKDLWVEVAAPAGPKDLSFGHAGSATGWDVHEARGGIVTGRLGLKKTVDLRVGAVYEGVLEPQPVSTEEVRYRVRAGDRVVALDSRAGQVRGLRAGHALIEASFGGVTKMACVVVGNATAQPDCADLR